MPRDGHEKWPLSLLLSSWALPLNILGSGGRHSYLCPATPEYSDFLHIFRAHKSMIRPQVGMLFLSLSCLLQQLNLVSTSGMLVKPLAFLSFVLCLFLRGKKSYLFMPF